MVDPSRHSDDRNWFESILRKIPGFHGYLEKQYRRESDLLARTWMADRLEASKPGLDETMRRLVDEARLGDLPKLDRIRGKLDHLIGRFRSAPAGYSGLFDYVKVREDRLDQVYQHDLLMMKEVDSLGEAIEGMPTSSDATDIVVGNIVKQIDEVSRMFDERGQLLEGLSAQ